MSTTIRELFVRLGVNADQKALSNFDNTLNSVRSTALRLGAVLATSFGVKAIVTAGSDAEKTRISFETMLGSVEKANKLLKDINQLTLKTPFTFEEATSTVKMMLAMGASEETVIDETRRLGDVASGLNVPMERLALNFGQVRTLGKLATRELRDFAIAGVPLLDVLAQMTGKTKTEVQDMVSGGQISFDMVLEAFKKMTDEGGKFANLMEKQSKTTGGLMSNLKDLAQMAIKEIGLNFNNKHLKPLLQRLLKWGQENNNIAKSLKTILGLVVAIGAGFAMWKIGQFSMAMGKMILLWNSVGKAALFAQAKMLLVPLLVGAGILTLIATVTELYNLFFTDKKTVFHYILEDLKTIVSYWKTEFVNSSLGKFLGLDPASQAEKTKAIEAGKEPQTGVKKSLQNWVNFEIERRGGKPINFANSESKLGETAGNMFSNMWTKLKDFATEDMATRRARYNSPAFGAGYEKSTTINATINVSNPDPKQAGMEVAKQLDMMRVK